MNALARESYRMQNPALGATLLWRFAKAHADADRDRKGPPLPLGFLVLPMIWQHDTAETIGSTMTNSGLRKFAAKFTETDAARDILLGIHPRAVRWRPKTQAALRLGLSAGLLGIEHAQLVSRRSANEPLSNGTIATMADAADKLGVWFASLSVHEVGLILHVQF